MQIYPADNDISTYPIVIQSLDDLTETQFLLTFQPLITDCRNPTISFRYELIDYDGFDEYLTIRDVTNDITLQQCGDRLACGEYAYCVKGFDLNTVIKAGQNYTIGIIEEGEVDALCSHDYTLNGEFTLQCNNKVMNESNNVLCDVNKYCYEKLMYPTKQRQTNWTQEIFHNNHEETMSFEVTFKAINDKCYNPELVFLYERIDFDDNSERIDVYDNASQLIETCGAGKHTPNECGTFDSCFTATSSFNDFGYDLGLEYIEMSDIYKVTLTESKAVDAICANHSYSINGVLQMICNPHHVDTTNYTYQISGSNTPFETVSEAMFSTQDYTITESRYDIIYNVTDYDCVDPRFSFSTWIKTREDYAQVLEVRDNDYKHLATCYSANSLICPRALKCVNDYYLNETLYVGDTYQFSIYESLNIVDETKWCDDRDFTIPHQVTLRCAHGPTESPTSSPTAGPTTAPTGRSANGVFDLIVNNVLLNNDGSYSIVFMTVVNEYVNLLQPALREAPIMQNLDDFHLNYLQPLSHRHNLCPSSDDKCVKFWELNMNYLATCDSANPLDLSGLYALEFTVGCRTGNRLNQCQDYLSANNAELETITLSTNLTYIDEICDSSIYSDPFESSFAFYTDSTFDTGIEAESNEFSLGSTMYVEVSVSGQYINNMDIGAVFVCTSDDELSMNSTQSITGNGGCLGGSSAIDEGSLFNILSPQNADAYNAVLYPSISESSGEKTKQRFAFQLSNPSNKPALSIQVMTSLQLESTENGRRRQLLQSSSVNTAVQMRSYLTSAVMETVSITSTEQGSATITSNDGSKTKKASNNFIILIVVLSVVAVCVLGALIYGCKRYQDKKHDRVSWQPATEMQSARLGSVSAGSGRGGYTVPMKEEDEEEEERLNTGTRGGYDEAPLRGEHGNEQDDEEEEDEDEDDHLELDDAVLTGGKGKKKKRKKYDQLQTGSPSSGEGPLSSD